MINFLWICFDCNFVVKLILFIDSNSIKKNYFICYVILEYFGKRKGGGVKKSLLCYSLRFLDREWIC